MNQEKSWIGLISHSGGEVTRCLDLKTYAHILYTRANIQIYLSEVLVGTRWCMLLSWYVCADYYCIGLGTWIASQLSVFQKSELYNRAPVENKKCWEVFDDCSGKTTYNNDVKPFTKKYFPKCLFWIFVALFPPSPSRWRLVWGAHWCSWVWWDFTSAMYERSWWPMVLVHSCQEQAQGGRRMAISTSVFQNVLKIQLKPVHKKKLYLEYFSLLPLSSNDWK